MEGRSIILIGGGGHCSSVIDVIEQEGKFKIAGIVEKRGKKGVPNLGYDIIGSDDDLPRLAKEYEFFFITIGQIRSVKRRLELYNELLKLFVQIPFIISPYAYVSPHARVGNGSVIMHMAQVNAGAIIGENCIINSKALVEHDAVVEDHCHLSTGTIVNGGVKVGSCSFIGSGAVCREYISIPEGSFIKANTVVKD